MPTLTPDLQEATADFLAFLAARCLHAELTLTSQTLLVLGTAARINPKGLDAPTLARMSVESTSRLYSCAGGLTLDEASAEVLALERAGWLLFGAERLLTDKAVCFLGDVCRDAIFLGQQGQAGAFELEPDAIDAHNSEVAKPFPGELQP